MKFPSFSQGRSSRLPSTKCKCHTPAESYDAHIRGRIATIAACIFFVVPAIIACGGVLTGFLGSADVEALFRPWALYFGPLTGAVFGYYFGASRDSNGRNDDNNTPPDDDAPSSNGDSNPEPQTASG